MLSFDDEPLPFAGNLTAAMIETQIHDEPLRIFLDELPWDLRSHNTDGRYVRIVLPQLSRFEPALCLIPQHSAWLAIRENAKAISAALRRRCGFPPKLLGELTSRLAPGELARSGAEVIFSHRAFPLNAGSLPVVWQQAILDPVMQRSYGVNEAALAEERSVKGALFRRAAMVQVSTQAEARRHAADFPDIADRFVAVPFFSPHIEPCSRELLERHVDATPVRLLFAGGQAWRKGLDLLLAAFAALPDSVRNRARLTILSNFDRSSIRVPDDPLISVIRGAGPARVLEEMRRSHIFVNLARFESYGIVFQEAMSQGLACVGPDWEVQRELLDYGRAGLNLPCNVEALRTALERLIVDAAFRQNLGMMAWTRFQKMYAPAVVAAQYRDIFRRAARRLV